MSQQLANDAPLVDEASDDQLMIAIRQGHVESFRTLYQRHSAILFAMCVRILDSRKVAEEVLLDVFREVWNHSERYDKSCGTPRTYLILLARSRALERKRKNGNSPADWPKNGDRQRVAELRNTRTDSLTDYQRSEEDTRARELLDVLSSCERQSLELVFFDGLSPHEVAKHLHISVSSAKTHITRGLTKLRELREPPGV